MENELIPIKHLYWLAALIEGEGYIGIIRRKTDGIYSGNKLLRIDINMTEEDVIRSIYTKFKMGTVLGPYKPSGTSKKFIYRWSLNDQKQVAGLLMTIYPLMGRRRQERIREALYAWREYPYNYRRLSIYR